MDLGKKEEKPKIRLHDSQPNFAHFVESLGLAAAGMALVVAPGSPAPKTVPPPPSVAQDLCRAIAKCVGWDVNPPVHSCAQCKGTGICVACKGEGGWVVQMEVMRTEKKKVVLDGLDKIQEQLVTVMIPEKQPCFDCGACRVSKTLELQATGSATHGNPFRSAYEVERTTHLGSTSSVTRNYVGDVLGDFRKDPWKGDGKCRACKGTGRMPEQTSPARKPRINWGQANWSSTPTPIIDPRAMIKPDGTTPQKLLAA